MNEKVAALLNNQINKEYYSAYLYLAFADYYRHASLDGFAHWFEVQAQEERGHALKFLRYLQDNDVKVVFEAIAAPDAAFSDFRQPLAAAYKHEQYVTSLSHAIYKEARQDEDYRCCQFLEWFIAEQMEEEKSARELLDHFDLLDGDRKGLLMLDDQLAQRPVSAAADN